MSPTKEKHKQQLVMEEVRIIKRSEEPPAPSAGGSAASRGQAPVAAVDQRAFHSNCQIGTQAPAVVLTKKMVAAAAAANAAVYVGAAAGERRYACARAAASERGSASRVPPRASAAGPRARRSASRAGRRGRAWERDGDGRGEVRKRMKVGPVCHWC